MMKRVERSMSRENRTHHERMWMGWMTDTARTWALEPWAMRCSVRCDDTLTQDEQDQAHSSVRVDMHCVEVSLGGQVVIGVGRVIVQRHHASITNYWILTFVLSVQLCTCSQTVCCDRQFFPVAIYCTLLHRENGSFEVLCLHLRRLQ